MPPAASTDGLVGRIWNETVNEERVQQIGAHETHANSWAHPSVEFDVRERARGRAGARAHVRRTGLGRHGARMSRALLRAARPGDHGIAREDLCALAAGTPSPLLGKLPGCRTLAASQALHESQVIWSGKGSAFAKREMGQRIGHLTVKQSHAWNSS